MATIYNSDLTKELTQAAGLQQARDIIPNQLAEKVVPVMEVNPNILRKNNFVFSASSINATSTTLTTVPSDKEFWITNIVLSMIKDVTATSVYSRILGTPHSGPTQALLEIIGLTLTVQSGQQVINLNAPIRMKAGTTITIVNSTNVGNVSATGIIYGYYVLNSNA